MVIGTLARTGYDPNNDTSNPHVNKEQANHVVAPSRFNSFFKLAHERRWTTDRLEEDRLEDRDKVTRHGRSTSF